MIEKSIFSIFLFLVVVNGCSKVADVNNLQKEAAEDQKQLDRFKRRWSDPKRAQEVKSLAEGQSKQGKEVDPVEKHLPNPAGSKSTEGDQKKFDDEAKEILDEILSDMDARFGKTPLEKYRNEHFQHAITESLERLSGEFRIQKYKRPVLFAVLALSYFKTDRFDEADEYRKKLVEAMKLPEFADDLECKSWLQEVNDIFNKSKTENESGDQQ